MKEFFDGMSTLEQAYWIFAIIGSAIFVIIFILTFIGGDTDTDMEADSTDFEADDGGVGFQFFTLKNVIAFFTIFGWTGLICIGENLSTALTILLSTIAGLIMMALTSLLFFWMHKLSASGTLKIKNAIGLVGEVYIPIKANRKEIGKVQINVQGSLRELDAVTDSDEDLKTSTIVKVVDIISDELLLVEKISK